MVQATSTGGTMGEQIAAALKEFAEKVGMSEAALTKRQSKYPVRVSFRASCFTKYMGELWCISIDVCVCV